jgi:hypothetical protein
MYRVWNWARREVGFVLDTGEARASEFRDNGSTDVQSVQVFVLETLHENNGQSMEGEIKA